MPFRTESKDICPFFKENNCPSDDAFILNLTEW